MQLSSTLKTLLRNPFTIWIKWLIKKYIIEYQYKEKHLSIGYMAKAFNCKFGKYNALSDRVVLNNVVLGDFSYIANDSVLTNTTVGKFVCIGEGVLCGLGKHPTRKFVSVHPIFYSQICQAQITFATDSYFEEYAPISIGNDVWIGARAMILDGVKIGNGVIVGAGAVVTTDVPEYAVVAGVPAKILRYRFDPAEIDYLTHLKWWDKDVRWLRENYLLFQDIKIMQKMIMKRKLS